MRAGLAVVPAAVLAAAVLAAATRAQPPPAGAKPAEPRPASFQRDVLPILTAHCAGCHQPAKAGGGAVFTTHGGVVAPGRDGNPLVEPGKPDASPLIAVLRPTDGAAPKMPKGRPPLDGKLLAVLVRWIAEGAADDSAASAAGAPTMERPPVYRQPPVVTSLDWSPDGSLLAVSGHHEVLVFGVNDAGTEAALRSRLVGLSERIQSVAFSPDGARLLVLGGSPARFGEVQIWTVADRKLRASLPIGSDTLYGGSWSADGRLIAFGGGDNSVRVLDAALLEPVFFNAASEDLVLDTAWSKDGTHLVSVGRDRALKLYQLATQQFLDNVTSITPGALKGGLMAVDRHPASDLLLCGGADGGPRTYNMHRTKDRKIGDDFNLVRAFAPMPGRICAVEWSADGERFLAASSTGAGGEVRVYSATTEAPLWSVSRPAGLYAASFRPSRSGFVPLVAAGGFAGRLSLLDVSDGAAVLDIDAAPLGETQVPAPAAPSAPGG